MFDINEVKTSDPEIYETFQKELKRQTDNVELIASENFVSKAVMAAMGSWHTNKYAEGYPGKRYYGGCQEVDVTENIAIDRLKKLFGADHANVQPHSGASANLGVFFAALKPGDKVMGMNLSHGGHLSHGSPVNISGKYYEIIPYGVNKETGTLDYKEFERIAHESKPKMIVAGGSAYPRELDFEFMGKVAKDVGCYFMADVAHIAGLIVTGHHQNPTKHADFVTSTTHKTLRGPRGGVIMCKEEHKQMVDKAIFPGIQGGPLMHVIAAKAVAFKEALNPSFGTYISQVVKNAKTLGSALVERGFNLVSGGTDTHLLLLDLQNKNLTGKEAEHRLDEIRITCNKNTVPFDPQSPFVTSGIRIGTPAMTTRGMKESDMVEIADIISITLNDFEGKKSEAIARVQKLISNFPLY